MKSRKPLTGCTFSILGDSYSTFQGYVPEGNEYYYPSPERVDDVLRVEDTWWYQLMHRRNMRLLINESYSGATVCSQVRDHHPTEAAFIERVKHLASVTDSSGKGPEYIILFGCTNDSWLGRTCGEVQFGNWSPEDLAQVLPAFCYVLDTINRENPEAVVVAVINTNLAPEITAGMARAGEHYGAINVSLTEIDKQNGHPSALGMRQIADQIEMALR